ncbi:2-5A-dependent ribonuclease [Antechinus flavipes]|uniref:2-5A-dependent ribonuclease n=1 Tax=Antechinus flavipes TaxID=38775 RepID=UPI002235B439|nr:2-5A-dependent ribonuclease [Antechinus flavipes]
MEANNSNSQQSSTVSSSPEMICPPLIQAVKEGDFELVKQLLEKGADVNIKMEGGWTPLHNAAKEGNKDIVELLLEKGADLHIRKENGATPFIVAAIVGDVELLELFLSKGANINEYDNHGFTAFMEAAYYGHQSALEFLYEKGVEVNLGRQTSEEQKKLRKGGCTALMDAARKGHIDVVKILLEKMEADVNARDNMGRNALIHTFRDPKNKNVKEIVCFLLKSGIDVNVKGEKGKTPLILAVEKEDVELVQMILEKSVTDINVMDSDENTAILIAVRNDHLDIVRLLCEKGAELDSGELINIAQGNHNQEMVKFLRKKGARENVSHPPKSYKPNSQQWGKSLMDLHRRNRPMIGKLKILVQQEFKIAETSEGGVYLGFYDGKEVAVKRFQERSRQAQQELDCIQHCKNSNLVSLYGRESQNNCIYLCFALCERTLEEHLTVQREMDFQTILKSLFKAVQELHRNNYAHQDLHPRNILIDYKGEVYLADFDKSEKLDEDQQKIKDDMKALGRLVLYMEHMGEKSFTEIQTQSDTEVIEACINEEIKDIVQNLLNPGEEFQNQLSEMLDHPFFWNSKIRYKFLQDMGNLSDIKKRKKDSDVFMKFNQPNSSKDWRETIDENVFRKMNDFYKKIKKPYLCYENTVGDLLKFIRNLGTHFEEETNADIKRTIGEPSEYFKEKFPNLVIYVYKILRNMNYRTLFPSADSF